MWDIFQPQLPKCFLLFYLPLPCCPNLFCTQTTTISHFTALESKIVATPHVCCLWSFTPDPSWKLPSSAERSCFSLAACHEGFSISTDNQYLAGFINAVPVQLRGLQQV